MGRSSFGGSLLLAFAGASEARRTRASWAPERYAQAAREPEKMRGRQGIAFLLLNARRSTVSQPVAQTPTTCYANIDDSGTSYVSSAQYGSSLDQSQSIVLSANEDRRQRQRGKEQGDVHAHRIACNQMNSASGFGSGWSGVKQVEQNPSASPARSAAPSSSAAELTTSGSASMLIKFLSLRRARSTASRSRSRANPSASSLTSRNAAIARLAPAVSASSAAIEPEAMSSMAGESGWERFARAMSEWRSPDAL